MKIQKFDAGMFMRKSIQLLLICSLLGMVLSSCSPVASSGTVRKKYKQDINRVQWSPDGQFLVLDYMYGKKLNNDIYGDHLLYTFDFSLKQTNLISESQYYCGLFYDKEYVISTKKVKGSEPFFYLFQTNGSKEKVDTPNPSCSLYLNAQFIILFKDINQENKLLKLNRATQEITPIEPDETVQKFIQDEKISDYEIEHIFEKNGTLRLVLQASHKVEGLPANEHPPVTYATALLQDNKITQIDKLYHLEKPFDVHMFFWGLSPDNKLIFGTVKNLPPLEYFEYDYEKHQRNPRPDLNKINDHLKDGRILKPEAFSPDFTQLVYILARSEDSDKNPIRDFILLDLKTGKEETLFNINTTFPKGDFTWSY